VGSGIDRGPPYDAVAGIYGFISERRHWHLFDGWCAARGVDPLALTTPRFLDLAHYWIVEEAIFDRREEKHRTQRNDLNEKFIGTLVETPVLVVQGIEIKKPSWFRETTVDLDQLTQQLGRRRAK
jgi:hypothetical protein